MRACNTAYGVMPRSGVIAARIAAGTKGGSAGRGSAKARPSTQATSAQCSLLPQVSIFNFARIMSRSNYN